MENIIDFYSKYSFQYDQKIGTLDLYNDSYIDFVNFAKRKGNLLDLACGGGNVSAFIKKLMPSISITCVDLSLPMLEIAKEKLKNGNFYQSDILDIQIPIAKYDLIVCAFGLPYISNSDIYKFVSQIDKFADKETVVYISCMQGDKTGFENMSFANNDKVLVNYHTKVSIIDNFKQFNFNLLKYKEQIFPELDGSQTIDMIFNFSKSN